MKSLGHVRIDNPDVDASIHSNDFTVGCLKGRWRILLKKIDVPLIFEIDLLNEVSKNIK